MQALHQNFWFTKRYDLNLQGSCPDQKRAYIIMYISHRKGDCEQVLCNYRSCSQPRCWGSFIVVRLIATLQLFKGWHKWANFIVAETKIIITSTTMYVSSATLLLWLLSSLMLGGRGMGSVSFIVGESFSTCMQFGARSMHLKHLVWNYSWHPPLAIK